MAGIIDGVWSGTHSIDPQTAETFSNWITIDGSPGPGGRGGFPAVDQRYHLYLARGCPFSHRVSIAANLLGFGEFFTVTFVDDIKQELGWRISEEADPVFQADSLQAVMIAAEGNLTSETAVPLLIDKDSRRIVSDSSADMVRMMDNLAAEQSGNANLLWPVEIADKVDELNGWLSSDINGGVYRVLFEPDAGEQAVQVEKLRAGFSEIDKRLSGSRYLHGEQISASDIWLFPTLLRFDSIYSELFGLRFKIGDFKNLGPYLRDLWTCPAFSATSDLIRIEKHYYCSLIHGPHGPVEPGKGKVASESLRFKLD